MIRVSFGIYNTEEEVDEFLKILAVALDATKAQVEDLRIELGEDAAGLNPAY